MPTPREINDLAILLLEAWQANVYGPVAYENWAGMARYLLAHGVRAPVESVNPDEKRITKKRRFRL